MIEARPFPDWILAAFDRVWVTSAGGDEDGIGVLDPATGEFETFVEVEQEPCGSIAEGFDSVWTATCGTPGVARIDGATHEVTAHIELSNSHVSETSIGVDETAVWALMGGDGCLGCQLVKIDPQTDQVVATYPIPDNSQAVRAGQGGVWITRSGQAELIRVDPATGQVVATIPVGAVPRFLAVGEEGVWVLNQMDGSASHVDPATNEVTGTVDLGAPIQGGDIAVGQGAAWTRGGDSLVVKIDPATDEVLERYEPGKGGGSVAVGEDGVWASSHDVRAIYRLPLSTAPDS